MKTTLLDQLRAAGFDPIEHRRLGVVLDSMKVDGLVGGYPISFTRRRYGTCDWYTWADYYTGGQWISAGDPWPKSRPSAAEVLQAIQAMQAVRLQEVQS